MRTILALTEVLEHVYAPVPDTQAWLEGIRAAASTAFDGHLGALAYTVRVRDDGVETVAASAEAGLRAMVDAAHRDAGATLIGLYRSGLVQRGSQHSEPPSAAVDIGVDDIITAIGFADGAMACIVAFALADRRHRIARTTRGGLARLSAHLGAAYRLRIGSSGEDLDAAAAVLTPGGGIVHASGEAKDKAARERLRDAALGIVRARREAARDPAASLAFWTAMVDGRWTLVERFDSDGKRFLLARENAPFAVAHHALTSRERAVVERAALGASVRHVAYELGLAESTVSVALARALKKLGLRSHAELMELRLAIAAPHERDARAAEPR